MMTRTSLTRSDVRLRDEALRLLRQGTGDDSAEFREGQWEAIHELISGSRRLLLVQRAGWGKSMVYFIAAKLLRVRGAGPTLLVSPLLALMRNQEDAANRMGVATRTINSSNVDKWTRIEAEIERGEVDLLLISPERFGNHRFRSTVLPAIADVLPLLVVDEAHCISDWGHDFRPHYRQIKNVLPQLPHNTRILATTATANDRVMQDVREVLGAGTQVRRGQLALPNISFQTFRLDDQAERMAWLAENVTKFDGSGIIYALTIRDVDRVAGFLQSRGIDARAYHSEIHNDNRQELETKLINNEVKALVATTALGMGFDKPDLKFVVHFQSPGSPVAYYQQVGRAGRAVDGALAILLRGTEDDGINDYFINFAFPSRDEVEQVLEALEGAQDGLTLRDFESRVNMPNARLEKTLELLALESPSPVHKEDSIWYRTSAPRPGEMWKRIERITKLRREEQEAMRVFAKRESGQMGFLLAQLDSTELPRTPISAKRFPTHASMASIELANQYLRRQWLQINPRKRWPPGFRPPTGSNKATIQWVNETGRALCVYGDARWGRTVARGKYAAGRFDDELVDACVQMIQEAELTVLPDWVTNVPSRSGKPLVKNFAERLAKGLGLDYVESLFRNGEPESQKSMQNSTHQARNAWDSLTVAPDEVRGGAVFLVDDIVDSRWTLTVAGYRLMECGSGSIIPIALASATKSGADS